MRNINALHPKLIEKLRELQSECLKKGLKIGIGECLRTKAEQDELYAQGRTKAGNIVTNAKGSTYSSMHQWGVAFDFYRNDGKGAYFDTDGFFSRVGEIGKSIGLEWGGDWKKPVDKPHFQLPYWGSTATKLKTQYGIPENFFKTWEDKTMLETGNDIVWELMNGKHKVEILDVDRAVKALDNAKKDTQYCSLYWILYKLVNGNG